MTLRQKVFKLAKELEAVIEERGTTYDGWDITVDAPAGYVWSSWGDLHGFVANNQHWPDEGKNALWADLYDRMQYGIEKCEIPNCEVCNNL